MMDSEERTFSPGKGGIPADNLPRAFYAGGPGGGNTRIFPENLLPYHIAGYPLNCTSSYSTAGSSGQTHASNALQLQPGPAVPHSVSTLHPPATAAVGVVHSTGSGTLHVEAAQGGLLPHVSWTQGGQSLTEVTQQQQQQSFQRLKVEDALSYLDQVKFQFSGQPQVYNDFLDIMKEFKSQSIDTPGVITRVSNLFRGHPDLIVGFNTFLPPGYKIEVQANETISVHQPGQQAISLAAFQGTSPMQPVIRPAHFNSGVNPTTLAVPRPDVLAPPTQVLQPNVGLGAGSNVPPAMVAAVGVGGAGQPVEFNHAIQYVNKIKQCYQNQPEIYKSFLDILHQYQKEQKILKEGNSFPAGYHPLSEIEVYSKVTELFKDQPQLLAEFSQFLPDAGSGSGLMSGFGASTETSNARQMDAKSASTSGSMSMSMRASSQQMRRTASASGIGYQPPSKKSKGSSEIERTSRLRDSDKRRRELMGDEDTDDAEDLLKKDSSGSQLQPSYRMRLYDPASLSAKLRVDYELEGSLPPFEERNNCNVARSDYFVDLSTCKPVGPSYRQLPKSYVHPICSGRTELCNEVLNDTYVLYAMDPKAQKKDADEKDEKMDKGSNFNKKNQFEEHLFQCEDERYELDMILDLNNMAKSTCNSISSRIKAMSQDEAAKFRLDDKLGSNSEVLMQIAIGRLYGENTRDIINGLKCNPVAAVPVVLKRLISKEKEWRDAQKEFNRIWREQNERFFLKSLDHQATKFKQSDVKRIRSKSLLREMEVISEEVKKYDSKSGDDEKKGKRPSPYMPLVLNNSAIMADAVSLIENHIRRQAGLQPEDKTRIVHIVHVVLPKLLNFQLSSTNDNKDGIDRRENGAPDQAGDSKRNMSKLTWVKVEPVVVPPEANGEDVVKTKTEILFFCNDHWYLFLRLYVLLCDRLQYFNRVAKQLAEEEMHFRPLRSELIQQALNLRNPNTMDMNESYGYLLESVRGVLDGTLEISSFEEQTREVFGSYAYVAYTLDKLVQNIGRQLQHIVSKDSSWQLVDMFESGGGTSSSSPAEYQKKVEEIIADENCFKISIISEQSLMKIELIDSVASSSSDENVERDDVAEFAFDSSVQKPTFLSRNLRKVMYFKRKQQSRGGSTGHRLTWTTTEGREEICLPTELQLINSTSMGDAVVYTCGALKRARQTHASVSRRMSAKFTRWLSDCWQIASINATQINAYRDWLLGKVDGLKQGLVTRCHQISCANNQPPYHSYCKYSVLTSE